MAERESTLYPLNSLRFSVELLDAAGNKSGDVSFQEVSGISTEIPVEEIQEGGENRFAHRVPQPLKYSNLVLKKGVVSKDSDLSKWCKSTINSGFASAIELKNVTIILQDDTGAPFIKWTFKNAYPVKWDYSPLDATKNQLFIQSVELCFQMFEEEPTSD